MPTDKDKKTTIQELKNQVENFCHERDWDPFHSPKDLAIGVVTEGAELLEMFRFQDEDQVKTLMSNPEKREKVADELADVLFFLIRFGQKYNFDLAGVFQRKMSKNAQRYSVAEFKGKNHKAQRSVKDTSDSTE